jgi:hypothetical protein
MISRNIILIYSFLYQVQAENLRIKCDILGSIPGDGANMMNTTKLHVFSPFDNPRMFHTGVWTKLSSYK